MDMITGILVAALLVGGTGLLIGIFLGIAGEKLAVEGICNGTIGFEPKGDGNFGYDPIFVYNNDKTFAEMSSEEKDKVSHRGKALILLQKELKKYLEEN